TPNFRILHVLTPSSLHGLTLSNGHASEENSRSGAGGAILVESALELHNCTLTGNRARGGGNALWFVGREGSVLVNNCTVDSNDHPDNAFAAIDSSGLLTVRN